MPQSQRQLLSLQRLDPNDNNNNINNNINNNNQPGELVLYKLPLSHP